VGRSGRRCRRGSSFELGFSGGRMRGLHGSEDVVPPKNSSAPTADAQCIRDVACPPIMNRFLCVTPGPEARGGGNRLRLVEDKWWA
jgi:hypothetical protein